MNGLYALKPWYADRLSGVRGALARRRISPDALTAAGVAAAAAAGGAGAPRPAGVGRPPPRGEGAGGRGRGPPKP
ncbi:hypothetical protein ACFW0U_09970, partial [Streptomyces albidoflavus]